MLRYIPNILSVSRFPLSVLLVFFVTQPALFVKVFVFTAMTAILDGWLARKLLFTMQRAFCSIGEIIVSIYQNTGNEESGYKNCDANGRL